MFEDIDRKPYNKSDYYDFTNEKYCIDIHDLLNALHPIKRNSTVVNKLNITKDTLKKSSGTNIEAQATPNVT